MYFLKKLTNFGKNGNEIAAGTGNSSTSDVYPNIQTGMDNKNMEVLKNDKLSEDDVERPSSSSSSLSIPDCFFDDVPETPSSDNIEIVSSEDTDSQEESASAHNSHNQYENAEYSTYKFISAVTVDESSERQNEFAEKADCRNKGYVEKQSIMNSEKNEIREDYDDQDQSLHLFKIRSEETDHLKCYPSGGKVDDAKFSKELTIGDLEDPKTLYMDDDNSLDNTRMDQLEDDIDENNEKFFDSDEKNDYKYENLYLNIIGLDYIEELLDKENDKAEARLAARRQARVEAREIRLRELERQQKEQEENADRAFDMSYVGDTILRTGRVTPSGTSLNARDRSMATANSYHSSRRSSEDSIEEGLTLRDIRHELKEAEEKFKKAMIANAQLDNEKSALAYQVELLKDRFEDLEETHAQLTREHRDKCREHEQLKRAAVKMKEDLEYYKTNLLERDTLITEYGLVIVDADEDSEGKPTRTLVSTQSAELLQEAGSGSLDVRLKKFSEERNELLDEIRHLKLELEEERSKRIPDNKAGYGSLTNGPLDEETSKILSDYKFKLQKAEQDVSTLQANVARLESQVIRYKTAAESSEKAEDELKIEKRKLQRENRESIARIEELETANSHLQRRMDKLKNAKSTLLKEL